MKFYIVGHTESNKAIYQGVSFFNSEYTIQDVQNNIKRLDNFYIFTDREEAANYARSLRVQYDAKMETEHNRRAAPLVICNFKDNHDDFLNDKSNQITREISIKKYRNNSFNSHDDQKTVIVSYFELSRNHMPAFQIIGACFPDMYGDASINKDLIIPDENPCLIM